MKMLVYEDAWFERVVHFLRANWARHHALYDRELFDWQYRTDYRRDSLMLVDQDRIQGFLGNIPGTYSLSGQLVRGIGLTLWCVAKELRNCGLGVVLIREAEKQNQVVLTLGANRDVIPMYQRMGYNVMPRLWRWVSILEQKDFEKLLTTPTSNVPVRSHFTPLARGNALPPVPSPDQLASLYETVIRSNYLFTQHRDANFWEWRYFSSPGFHYEVFGDTRSQGAAVVRVELVYAPDQPDVDGLKVLRVIELIPASHPGAVELLNDVLVFGLKQGCCAADFQCSTRQMEPILQACGFREQSAGEPHSLFPQLFQPFRSNVPPINFVYKIIGTDGKPMLIDPEQTYFVKSDCDMDRPNFMPVPQ
jgi:GNAT superfamily N-acetyltransferase